MAAGTTAPFPTWLNARLAGKLPGPIAGDNLSLIALRFGVTVREIKQTNNLDSDLLKVGQKLRFDQPFHRTGAKDVSWNRPCRRTRAGSAAGVRRPTRRAAFSCRVTGVEVACPVAGTRGQRPANGVVRHIGRMDGYGTIIIVEHGGGYATVFSPFEPASIEVRLNQAVLRGDPLGRTSAPEEPAERPYLHIQLRQNDKAIKPDRLLQ